MKTRSRHALIAAAVAAVSPVLAHAADLTWDSDPGTAGIQDASGFWDTATANWYDGTSNILWPNTTTDSAIFGSDANPFNNLASPNNIDFAEALNVQNITLSIGANGGVYNLTEFFGGTLNVAGNITKSAGAGNNQIQLSTFPLTLTAGNHIIAANDTGGDNAPELTINSEITGAGDITIDNGSYVTWGSTAFNVTNAYTGATNINKGRLIITQAQALGSAGTGTTISNMGTLAIAGANSNVTTNLNIAEPITITRNTYTGTDFDNYKAAIIVSNDGTANTHTLSGPLVIDSTDARIQVDTNTLNIPTNITEGPTVTPGTGVLTLGGDFAGFVNLTGDNTGIGGGGIRLIGGVELNVSNDNNLGGPTAPLQFLGSATLHPIGGWMTTFGSHPINNTTFSGGFDIDENQTFTVDQNLGDAVTAVGSLGKRGLGTLNLNSTINLRGGQTFFDAGIVNVNGAVTLHSLHLRSPVLNIGTGGSVTTTTGFNAIGQDSTGTNGGPDKAIVNITGSGQLAQTNNVDFNISDNANTEGTINLQDNGVLSSAGLVHVAKSNGAKGTINQSGNSTFTLTRTGNFTLVLGSRRGLGTYNLSGGTMTSAGEFYVGQGNGAGNLTDFGTGVFTMTGGTVNQNNWFVVGREGGKGTIDISGGVFNKAGGGNMPIGESQQDNLMTIRGNAQFVATTGEFWVANGGGNKATLNVQDTAVLTVPNWFVVGRGGALGTLNISGGTVTRTATNTGNNNYVGEGSQQNSVLNLSGSGSLTINGGQFWLGNGGSSKGTMNISGNAVFSETTGTANNNAGQNWIAVGRNGTAQGVLNLSGNGTINSSATYNLTANTGTSFVIASGATATGTFTQTGGTVNAQSMAVGETGTGTYSISAGNSNILTNLTVGQAGGGNGTFSISGTANVVTGPIEIGHLGTSQGKIDLNGGTLTAASVKGGASTGANRVFNFNGGTLKPSASDTQFMQGLSAANVQSGGALIDTNGFDIAIAQQLNAASSAGLTKSGAGTLSMTNVRLPSLTVSTGKWQATPQANPYVVASEVGTSKVTTLSAPGTLIDLTNTKIITQDASMVATPVYDPINDVYVYDGIHGLVQKGRGDGTWNGTSGITTSQTEATAGILTSLAVGTGAELRGLGPTQTELFAGQTINGNSAVAMYTYTGDADMDGDLDGDDYFYLDSNVLQSETVFGWHQGDFNYDGRLNGDDYFFLDSNIAQAQSSGNVFWVRPPEFGAGGGGTSGLTAVPEPASIGLIGIAAAGALGRRRRSR